MHDLQLSSCPMLAFTRSTSKSNNFEYRLFASASRECEAVAADRDL